MDSRRGRASLRRWGLVPYLAHDDLARDVSEPFNRHSLLCQLGQSCLRLGQPLGLLRGDFALILQLAKRATMKVNRRAGSSPTDADFQFDTTRSHCHCALPLSLSASCCPIARPCW
jgi:hypothetical protein